MVVNATHNNILETGNEYNDTVTYNCSYAHEFVDGLTEKTFRCLLNKEWEEPPGFCKGEFHVEG